MKNYLKSLFVIILIALLPVGSKAQSFPDWLPGLPEVDWYQYFTTCQFEGIVGDTYSGSLDCSENQFVVVSYDFTGAVQNNWGTWIDFSDFCTNRILRVNENRNLAARYAVVEIRREGYLIWRFGIKQDPSDAAVVSITKSQTMPICSGTSVSFSAHPDCAGSTPFYSWFKNGTLVSSGSTYTTSTLVNNDIIKVEMNPGACCSSASASTTVKVQQCSSVGTPTFTYGATTRCQGSETATYTASASSATGYIWTITGTGNTISGTGATATVNWSSTFSGTATIGVKATNGSNVSSVVTRTVTVKPTPNATISGAMDVCLNAASPVVSINNPQSRSVVVAYTVTKDGIDNTTVVNIASNSSNTISVPTFEAKKYTYKLENVAYSESPTCPKILSATTSVTVKPSVGTPSAPSGNTIRCMGTGTTSYTTSAANANSYTWSVTGVGNTISGTGSTATVNWGANFQGTADVKVIANGCNGPSVAAVTSVSVYPHPQLTIAPIGGTICSGGNHALSAGHTGYSGGSGMQYQWYKDGNSISNATSATFNATQAGDYFCLLSPSNSTCATIGTSTVKVTVEPDPQITSQPSGGTICNQGAFNLSVAATGGTPQLNYQWQYYNGSSWNNVTNAVPSGATYTGNATVNLVINGISTAGSHKYRCLVSATGNGCNSATSNEAIVTVRPLFSVGSISTSGETLCPGDTPQTIGSATAASGGNGVFSYQWKANGVVIPGATGASYTPPTSTIAQTTTYTRWVKDGACNTSYSQSSGSWILVVLSPFNAGAISTTGQTICLSETPQTIGSVTAASGGNGVISYQWKANGVVIPGATGASYTPSKSTIAQTITYTRWAKDGKCNTSFSQSLGSWILVVLPPFDSGEIPNGSSSICSGGIPGTIGSLRAASGGNGVITYQWTANGVVIPGAIGASYTPGSPITQTTTYTRWAKDGKCNTSFTQLTGGWTFTVLPLAYITNIIGTGVLYVGESLAFTVNAFLPDGASGSWSSSDPSIATVDASGNVIGVSVGNCQIFYTINDACAGVVSKSIGLEIAKKYGDTFSNPIVASFGCGSSFSHTVNTANGYTNDFVGMAANDVYYQFTLSSASWVAISTCKTSFDTYLSLLNQNSSLVASNDDRGPMCSQSSTASIVTFLDPGTYYVVSEGYGAINGLITTEISIPQAFPPAFDLGSTSQRCQGAETIQYRASTSINSVITYTIDNSSYTAGNRINSIGQITFVSGWSGQTTITAETNGSCGDKNFGTHVVTTLPASQGGILSSDQTICSGSVPTTLTLTGASGTIKKWQSSVYPFTEWVDISQTSTTYNPEALTQATKYRVVVQRGTCPEAYSSVATITVNARLVPSVTVVAANNPSCQGTEVTFTATPVNGGVSPAYQWSKNSVVVPGATLSTYKTTGLANGDKIKVVLTTSETCVTTGTATSNEVTATVSPKIAITVNDATDCGADKGAITVDGLDVTKQYEYLLIPKSQLSKPVITLLGTSSVTIPVGSTYTDAGATAADAVFGDLTNQIVVESTVNTAVAGTYTVTYTVSNSAGLQADAVVRTVVVGLGLPQQNWEEVTIGTQTWMKYNLVIDDGQGGINSYNNDIANAHIYGYLYTWDAAVRLANSIEGWHLPSASEWNTLQAYLGGTNIAGGKLKEDGTVHWTTPNASATNSSLFTALPGGGRRADGTYYYWKDYGFFHSDTSSGSDIFSIYELSYNSSVFRTYSSFKTYSFSVRLIKDTP
jgi:uncharacterized protein (TIGR02145 family)